MLFFFMCDDLPFINTTQKTLKPSKKMFQCPGWMRKNFIPGNFSWRVAAETWDASCFKKGLLEKQQSVPNTCTILPLKKIFYQNLTVNRWIFQIPLKYIKLVIPKILFMLVLCSFNFYFKITWPSPTHHHHHQNWNFWPPPPPARFFLKFLPLPQAGGGCMPWKLN